MKRTLIVLMLALIAQFLGGCAAMLVPETADPMKKLAWAKELVENQDRPIPAERLIREALDIFESQNDMGGMAQAYRVYGLFFKAPSLQKWENFYRKNGFLEKEASFDARYKIALAYFEKSRDLYEKQQDFGALSNVFLQIGITHQLLAEVGHACRAFGQSLYSHQKFMQREPDAKVALPKPYMSFAAAILDIKKQAGCNL